jgi:SEC-C motif-containing protein
MRSRFAAYSEARVDYIVQTTVEGKRQEINVEELKQQCKNFRYLGLKILKTELGGKSDETGTVLFHASLQIGKSRRLHRELSSFVKDGGRWVYVDGETN